MLCAGCLAGFSSLSAQPILHDTFDTLNTTTLWDIGSTSGSGTIEVSGGNLEMQTGTTSGSHRNTLLTQAASYNPYGRVLTMTASTLTVNSADTTSTGLNSFYFMIGHADEQLVSYYAPNRAFFDSGDGYGMISVTVSTSDSGSQVQIGDVGSTYNYDTYAISGIPTDITFTLDGTAETFTYTLTLTGATYTDDGGNSISGTITHFTQTIDATDDIYFALGDINSGAVDVITNSTLGQIDVVQVPEPAASGLLLALAALFLAIRNRRQRA